MNIPPVILNAGKKHTATLVFLHGLGDTGVGWAGALNTIKPDYLKVICPTAPMLPVTINGGMSMPAWYDIMSLDEKDKLREDGAQVQESVNCLVDMVNGELRHNIPPERVIIGGFSQGGAVALRTALTSGIKFGGCIGLSCYLPGDTDELDVPEQSIETPVFQAHGDVDQVVSHERGVKTSQLLEKYFTNHKFVTYPGMGHEGTQQELEDVKMFIELFCKQ
jgi:lysophospholipase-2